MSPNRNRIRRRGGGSWCLSMALALIAACASPVGAQSSNFTEIYNSGLLTLGPDETLQLNLVNNNNVSDPALPDLPPSRETCVYLAQFLDGTGNVLQKQQQTLQPGQNFSLSVSGQSPVQARVDLSPGTTSGFAPLVADQCVVSDAILKPPSNDPVLFPPLFRTLGAGVDPCSRAVCKSGCEPDCRTRQCLEKCDAFCKRLCP